MKKILVTGAGGPAGINFTMSLRIAPEKLFLVGTEANKNYLPLASVDRKYSVPEAASSDYVDKLNEIIQKEKVEFVHPQPDVEVAVISENRERLKANVFLPSKKTVRICQDKLETARLLSKKGTPVTRTVELRRESDVDDAFEELGSLIWIRAKQGAGGRGSTPAQSKETALSWIKYWKSRQKEWGFIAQEYLPGRNIGFHSLWKNGELITSMARERIEYIYPSLAPSGVTGTPAVQRTIHDDQVNKVGTEAVLAIDPYFEGVACVDLKENKDGVPCITEINAGRMFTTSFFFSYASKLIRKDYFTNLPYLYVKVAYKERLPKIPQYNTLPKDIYWIRHMDAPAKLVKNKRIIGMMYK
jgi:carbamoyl-phosphate synthase large subunit